MIRIFIGFDPRETLAWHVLTHSILARSSVPVSFTPLALSNLQGLMWREKNPLQSTEFSFSRFLTPYLSGFHGWSLFMDCDMLIREDISKLWELRDDKYAVMCVKHNHVTEATTKFLSEPQTPYEKKNWSSLILFNNSRCTALTPDYVNTATGLQLHQFKWLSGDQEIGEVPGTWNHLVGCSKPNPEALNVHHTLGGPYFHEYKDAEHSDTWFAEKQAMMRVDQRKLIISSS
jgi:hypothetical protein